MTHVKNKEYYDKIEPRVGLLAWLRMDKPSRGTPRQLERSEMTTTTKGLVLRAQRAFKACPDTRLLKRELRDGNPYALALLRKRGADYVNADIATVTIEETR